MDQRRSFPWAWILLAVAALVIVGAVAYYLGATQAQSIGLARPVHRVVTFGHGFGSLGFWLPVLVIALLVGLLVAALARPSRPSETFEEWHRRSHRGELAAPGGPHADENTAPRPEGERSPTNQPPSGSTSA